MRKDCHLGSPHLRVLVNRGGFLRFLTEWIDRPFCFIRHRYKSENVVSLLCFVEIAQAFRDEV
ncbi:hypothetical protein [Acinetobacter ursingii]|uniref:hypothetical protein n=1 Tax=Acinetobacter ursingii TaxID=108980 RepID=UPI0030086465